MVTLIVSIVHTEDDRASVAKSNPDSRTVIGHSYPRSANSINPAGNQRAVEFLKWAGTKHPLYANVELEGHGDIVRLDVEVCYHVKDDELKTIAQLPQLSELVFNSSEVTDMGLKYLEAARSLKTLTIHGALRQRVTAKAIQSLQVANPSLVIRLDDIRDTVSRELRKVGN